NRRETGRDQFQGFSIVVDHPKLSEEQWIDDVASRVGVTCHKFPLGEGDLVDRLESATWHLDQPINHPNSIAIMLLAERSRPHVTVLLSGEGADELFGG